MTVYASAARTDDLFRRARDKVTVEDYLTGESVALKRAGQDLRGPCVLCDGGTSKFRVTPDGRWRCYGCHERAGDVIDLVAEHRRCTPYDAARWLLGEDVPVSQPAARKTAAPASGPSTSEKVAAEILAGAVAFEGTLAERYLLGRGIHPEVVAAAATNLRYHGSAKHHWDDRAGAWVRAPAMVARVVVAGADGDLVPTGGVHVTYLDRETAGKARLDRTKLMWGRQVLHGKPGGAWLIGPDGHDGHWGDLVVAEGIETALSVVSLGWPRGLRLRACAALSLNRLQGGLVRDADGCVDPFRPIGDPALPAFTWPQPAGAFWDEVIVAVDADMKDQRARVKTGRGKPVDQLLTADVRKRICGRLAVAAWKAAGAPRARAISPPPGTDFNDELRRVLALECGA